MRKNIFFACCMTALFQYGAAQDLVVENNCLSVRWMEKDKKIVSAVFTDKLLQHSVHFGKEDLFRVVLKNGKTIGSESFRLRGSPEFSVVEGIPNAVKAAERLPAKKITAQLFNQEYGISLRWEVLLRDSTNYVRQLFSFSAKDTLSINNVIFIRLRADSLVTVAGKVDGSPIVRENLFFGIEHPLSQTATDSQYTTCFLSRQSPVTAADSFNASTVWGVAPKDQLRRGFLNYVEKERAMPYRQFLHYNSWFDISWADRKLSEDSCLDRIGTFADSLIVKRKTDMNAFLFDDGWDDNQTLWQFNKSFPNGFAPLRLLAGKYHSQLGVWISPWGGYDEAKQQREKYGRLQNPPFETDENGFSLAGPNYYTRFKAVATRFVTDYGIAIFKYDGIGSISGANGDADGSSGGKVIFRKDFEAMLKLVGDLRKIRQDLYFSLTVGTWPSPFWLQHADNIWRSGWDNGLAGQGPKRQQWLTFRDAGVYKNIVLRAPLYPLNAVMNHGICIANNGLPAQYEMDEKNISDEIWSFFATGASLQELYINPHKLSAADWNNLANAIRWSRENADIMQDVHWVGGNPESGEVYGYAAWAPRKATLSLRNPSPEKKTFTITAGKAFELPASVEHTAYSFYPVNKGDKKEVYSAGESLTVTLEPFETIVFDAIPLQLFSQSNGGHTPGAGEYKWWNPAVNSFPVLEGQAWPKEVKSPYDRFPGRAQQTLNPNVWNISHSSAGLYLKFKTDAADIVVRYVVQNKGSFAMSHMPATGVSGIDLYAIDHNGNWTWAPGKFSFGDTIEYRFSNIAVDHEFPGRDCEYRLFCHYTMR